MDVCNKFHGGPANICWNNNCQPHDGSKWKIGESRQTFHRTPSRRCWVISIWPIVVDQRTLPSIQLCLQHGAFKTLVDSLHLPRIWFLLFPRTSLYDFWNNWKESNLGPNLWENRFLFLRNITSQDVCILRLWVKLNLPLPLWPSV